MLAGAAIYRHPILIASLELAAFLLPVSFKSASLLRNRRIYEAREFPSTIRRSLCDQLKGHARLLFGTRCE
jgi:hypothetical protein